MDLPVHYIILRAISILKELADLYKDHKNLVFIKMSGKYENFYHQAS